MQVTIQPPQTINDIAMNLIARAVPEQMLHKVEGRFVPISGAEAGRQIRALALGLIASGIEPDDRVAILSENRPEWAIADFAIQFAGAICVPVYPTLLALQVAQILAHSGAKLVFAGSRDLVVKALEAAASCPQLQTIVGFPPSDARGGAISLANLMERGNTRDAAEPGLFADRARARRPGDLATIVYTSGTTGEPKGVMLTHGNLVSNVRTCCDSIDFANATIVLSFLPLSHVLERMTDYCYFHLGITVAYAESLENVATNLLEVRPMTFAAVPRLYEKIFERIQHGLAATRGMKKRLGTWAFGVAKRRIALVEARLEIPAFLAAQFALADLLVYRKIREQLGGRLRFSTSGGAPLGAEIISFFWSINQPVLEGYGLTETSPVLTMNTQEHWKSGSVGRAIPGVELRIAGDGEIQARGPNIMRGYYNNPQATAEVLSADGWFSTGDVGYLDEEGFLFITDRKKEILVNAYGKNIAPAPIESALKASPWIAQPVLIGDRRKYVAALLVPDFERLKAWAAGQGLSGDAARLSAHPGVRGLLQKEVDAVNRRLPHHEQIVKFAVLDRELSIAAGELTPTMKVKRRAVDRIHKETIDTLYE